MSKTTITVTERADDYKADAGDGKWGAGVTAEAAVRDVEKSWPEVAGSEVKRK